MSKEPDEISEETKAKIQLWKARDPDWPDWYRWDGGWYESNAEVTRYTVWDNMGEGAVVFDVGSYEGEWTKRMATKYHGYKFYTFEPAPRAFGVAQKRLAEFDNIKMFNFGLGTTSGTYTLHDSQRDSASFVNGSGDEVDAQIMNVREFLQDEKVTKIALMSVNIEGGEFELLPYLLGLGWMRNIERMMIQWHSIAENASASQLAIQNALAKTHQMYWNHGAWEAWNLRAPSLGLYAARSTYYIPDIS